MSHQLAGCSGFLQGVGEHGKPVRIEFAARYAPFIVGNSGQGDDGGCPVGRSQGEGAEKVAEHIAQQHRLRAFLLGEAPIISPPVLAACRFL